MDSGGSGDATFVGSYLPEMRSRLLRLSRYITKPWHTGLIKLRVILAYAVDSDISKAKAFHGFDTYILLLSFAEPLVDEGVL